MHRLAGLMNNHVSADVLLLATGCDSLLCFLCALVVRACPAAITKDLKLTPRRQLTLQLSCRRVSHA